MSKQLGKLNARVIDLLDIDAMVNAPILIGDTNIQHMRNKHPMDYIKYHNQIENILSHPDYIRKNEKDGSIEYVKEFEIEGEFVKVAIRVSHSRIWYVRSLYVLNNNRVKNYIAKGTLIPY